MHALQTLLENYADLAFDFFEAWSHRNIFVVDPELAIVAPHQRGLDLDFPEDREKELQDEIKSLRRRLDNVGISPFSARIINKSYSDAQAVRQNTTK
jgi:kinetochore protein Mis12/MTW1